MSNNPKIANQIYAECLNSWRNMHLGFFYANIPSLLEKKKIYELIEKFEFPKTNDEYNLDKGMLALLIESQALRDSGFNSFSFFIFWNCIGNIFRAFKEGLDKEDEFRQFIQDKLNENYVHTKELVFFLRNFFSHNIDEKFQIHSDDIRANKYKTLIISMELASKKLNLGGPEINFAINLDFSKINGGDKLTDSLRLDRIFLFADFCCRLALDFEHSGVNKIISSHVSK